MSALDRRRKEPIEKTTSTSGSDNAAEAKLGPFRESIQLMYNISSAADITVEVSNDGSDWDPHYTVASADQTADDSEQPVTDVPDTAYNYVRAYYTGTDGNITELKLVVK